MNYIKLSKDVKSLILKKWKETKESFLKFYHRKHNKDQFEFQGPLVDIIAQFHFAQCTFVDFKLFQEINFTKFMDQAKMQKQQPI